MPAVSEGLDVLLQSLQAEGRWQSGGTFSLDLERMSTVLRAGHGGESYYRKGPQWHGHARLALDEFVELGLDQCLEFDLLSRQTEARAWLAGTELNG